MLASLSALQLAHPAVPGTVSDQVQRQEHTEATEGADLVLVRLQQLQQSFCDWVACVAAIL